MPFLDSRVICSYFCSLRPECGLNPADDRWDIQVRWWLAVGLMEASVGRVIEMLRPVTERSDTFIQKCDRQIRNVVAKDLIASLSLKNFMFTIRTSSTLIFPMPS
jgi:hypothetical protein